MRTTKSYHRIAIVVIISVLILAILFGIPIAALLSIGLEDEFVKWDIDNPYVDNYYSGWQEISLYSFDSFMIPENWTIENINGVLSITDLSGKLWAIGAVYGTEADLFSNYSEFIATFAQSQPIDTTIEQYSDFSAMGGSDINKILVHYSGNIESYYYIKLRDTSGRTLVFILFTDLSKKPDDFDIAEAIVYSFAY